MRKGGIYREVESFLRDNPSTSGEIAGFLGKNMLYVSTRMRDFEQEGRVKKIENARHCIKVWYLPSQHDRELAEKKYREMLDQKLEYCRDYNRKRRRPQL